jgi:hypothetical protein
MLLAALALVLLVSGVALLLHYQKAAAFLGVTFSSLSRLKYGSGDRRPICRDKYLTGAVGFKSGPSFGGQDHELSRQ